MHQHNHIEQGEVTEGVAKFMLKDQAFTCTDWEKYIWNIANQGQQGCLKQGLFYPILRGNITAFSPQRSDIKNGCRLLPQFRSTVLRDYFQHEPM